MYLWPINADQQGTPKQVRKVIDAIRAHHIPTVFSESTVSDKPARQVAWSGAHYGGVLYVDSLSAADGPVPTYLDLLRVTTQTIVNGINEGLESQPGHSAITVNQVTVTYRNGHTALRDATFQVPGGSIAAPGRRKRFGKINAF